MRKLLLIPAALLLALCLVLPVLAADIPAPAPDFYVNDLSGVLSRESRAYIINTNVALRDRTGAQVVVVTMETLAGADIDRFATELFRSYGIGDTQKNNGVLLLVITGDREVRIEVGYGLEGAINDAKAGRILDEYVVPYLKDNKWEEGIVNGFNAIMGEVKAEYGLTDTDDVLSDAPVTYKKQASEEEEGASKPLLAAMGISLVAGLITGAAFEDDGLIANLVWLALVFGYFVISRGIGSAIVALISCGIWQLIGYAITSPGSGSGGGSYSSGGGSYRSGGGSYGGHSGGGGRSGGGGASRKFR